MKILRTIALFEGLNEEEFKNLASISSKKEYKKDEILFYEGEDARWLYILTEGILEMYKTNPKGGQFFIHNIQPISIVAECVTLDGIPYPATAKFAKNGKIIMIKHKQFIDNFLKNPAVSLGVIKSLTKKIRIIEEVLHKEVVLNSEAKVAKFIVENGDLFMVLKHVKIASLLNTTPETLSRVLGKMKKQNLIKFNDNLSLEILNKDYLVGLFS